MRASLRFVSSLLALALVVFTCADPVRAQVTLVGGGNFSGGTVPNATTFSSVVTFSGGTVAAPGIVVNGTQTGIFSSGAFVAFSGANYDIARFETATNPVGLVLSKDAMVSWTNTTSDSSLAGDTILGRESAAVVQLGVDVNGTGVAQTIKGPDGITGSNVIGGNFTLSPGVGTGNAAGTQLNLDRAIMTGTGTTQQLHANAITPCESKTLSNTTGTATAIANVGVASNSSAAARATVSVQCTNGTEFASSISTSYQGFANKAGTIAFGTPQNSTEANGASTAGTLNCTVVPTWVANGNSVDFKVTPAITGAATITTAYVNVENLGPGAVTCK